MSDQRPQAVLWDMDGTLVDTEPYWIECETAMVERFGGTWSHEQALTLVGNDLTTSGTVLQQLGGVRMSVPDIVAELITSVAARVRGHLPWRPGARELLAALGEAGVPCALVTMSYRDLALAVVDALPAGTFAAVVAGDDVTHGKPHPEPYLTAAARLGVRPEDCVAIEDSVTGVTSAEAAGAPVLAVRHMVEIPPGPGRVLSPSLLGWSPERLGTVRDELAGTQPVP